MPILIEKPSAVVSPDILKELSEMTSELGQVIIHGICKAGGDGMLIRIWPSTYLFDQHSGHISELIHFEKISGFPMWTEIPPDTTKSFTLVFSGLPSSCVIFDLQEVIPQSNGFLVPGITRNATDVYFLDFSD